MYTNVSAVGCCLHMSAHKYMHSPKVGHPAYQQSQLNGRTPQEVGQLPFHDFQLRILLTQFSHVERTDI